MERSSAVLTGEAEDIRAVIPFWAALLAQRRPVAIEQEEAGGGWRRGIIV
jgi:hypothetical protein